MTGVPITTALPYFRGRKTAASLKQRLLPIAIANRSCYRPFRGRKTAASLKHCAFAGIASNGDITALPRSQDRGLIEAPLHRQGQALATQGYPFRGRKTAASLKRRFQRQARFSWLHRGPFRGRKTAASLKRCCTPSVCCVHGHTPFRGRKTAASLKRTARAGRCDPCAQFTLPRSQDRGLIEAMNRRMHGYANRDKMEPFRGRKTAASLKRTEASLQRLR